MRDVADGMTARDGGELITNVAGYDLGRLCTGARSSLGVRDVTELLDDLSPRAQRSPLPVSIAYQDACHLAHAQGVCDQPGRLLCGIPGVELRELTGTEICCGRAGAHNLLHPEAARELAERKTRAVLATGAQPMVTANPGCWMQVAATLTRMGERMPVAHIVQVLDASIQAVPAGRHLADALDGPRHAGLAQHPDGCFDPLAPFRKEYVHARRLPAGL